MGDHFVTRLTHTLEVAQIARTIGRALNLNEDLAEGTALRHDLGPPPFGAAGEGAARAPLEERERTLSPLAARSYQSRGRERPEEPSPVRTEYQRGRDRIIHCKAFRGL